MASVDPAIIAKYLPAQAARDEAAGCGAKKGPAAAR